MANQQLSKTIAKTVYKKGYILEWSTEFLGGYKVPRSHIPNTDLTGENDIQVVLVSESGDRLGDAICHYGSYGAGKGLWETMIDGEEDVTGYRTFEEVMLAFDAAIRRYEKKHGKKKVLLEN